jgi:hypothetical protein
MISRSLKALKPMHLRLRVALRQMADYPPHSIVGLPALSPTVSREYLLMLRIFLQTSKTADDNRYNRRLD